MFIEINPWTINEWSKRRKRFQGKKKRKISLEYESSWKKIESLVHDMTTKATRCLFKRIKTFFFPVQKVNFTAGKWFRGRGGWWCSWCCCYCLIRFDFLQHNTPSKTDYLFTKFIYLEEGETEMRSHFPNDNAFQVEIELHPVFEDEWEQHQFFR